MKKKKKKFRKKEKDELSASNTLSNVPASGATRRPLVPRRRIGGGWILWERHPGLKRNQEEGYLSHTIPKDKYR